MSFEHVTFNSFFGGFFAKFPKGFPQVQIKTYPIKARRHCFQRLSSVLGKA